MQTFVDSNCNAITVAVTPALFEGLPLVKATLVTDPTKGYIALDEGTGGFGDWSCPSDYGMPTLTWYGEGQRYPNAAEALKALLLA